MAEALHVGDPAIAVRLRRNARARRMILRVGRTGLSPTLTLPHGVCKTRAAAFLADQEEWLRRQIATGPSRVPVRDGLVLPFRGVELVVRAGAGRRPRMADGQLHVPEGNELPVRVAAFLKEAARSACADGVARHARALGRPARRITLRDPRSRWGSCTASGDLMFSWRLVLAPDDVLDYVIAHEVAHLAELNHSRRFWGVVRRLCPGFETPRDWLKRHGPGLHAYDFSPVTS